MLLYDKILASINSLKIVDTHEHLPEESKRPQDTDVLSEWLRHYFSSDIVSAGLPNEILELIRNGNIDIQKRWRMVEPYWRAAENTGYGRALSIAARDIYGIKNINSSTIVELNNRFTEARQKGNHYDFILKKKSRILLFIRDSLPENCKEKSDLFVHSMRIDRFVFPESYSQIKEIASKIKLEVYSLADWMNVTQKYIERFLNENSRVVCLKCGLAYQRNLNFCRVKRSLAEKSFNSFIKKKALSQEAKLLHQKNLSDWMMNFICSLAHEKKLVIQIHTGIQEGNGNILSNSNPLLMSELFINYPNVIFDLFHMGYPYVMETGALAKMFKNVFIDMCWAHIISPEAAKRALIEWLDTVPANKISAFGGDYCFIDGVYGHQYIARENVAKALATKVIDKSISLKRAEELAKWLFVKNPVRLFSLKKFLEN